MSPSLWQILIVVGIIVLLFGAKRLPSLGKSMGEAIKGFKEGIDDNTVDVTEESKEQLDKSTNQANQESAAQKSTENQNS